MTQEIDLLIHRALGGKATPEEMCTLADWVQADEQNRLYFYQLKKIWNLSNNVTLSQERKQKELKRFLNRIHRTDKSSHSRRIHIIRWATVAASVIFVLGLSKVYWNNHSLDKIKEAQKNIHENIPIARLILANGDTIKLSHKNDEVKRLSEIGISHDSLQGLKYTEKNAEATGLPSQETYNTLEVPTGMFYSLELADGSKVWVNSSTNLRYPIQFIGKERKVYLSGEAYFEVVHDENHPFIVETEGINVQVYGTQFNINTYDKDKNTDNHS